MALLQVRGLTMRFAGLTAVDQVEFDLNAGEVLSIIGPNGAGKTTVFNAVTGIYPPTRGAILFENRELRRPLRWGVLAGCLAIGLVTGLVLLLLFSNLDALWRTAIKSNNDDDVRVSETAEADFEERDTDGNGEWSADEATEENRAEFDLLLARGDRNGDGQLNKEEYFAALRRPFSWSAAWTSARSYFLGEPQLVKRNSKWQVLLPFGERRFAAPSKIRSKAEDTRRKLLAAITAPHELTDLVREDDRLVLYSADKSQPLFTYDDEEQAADRLELIAQAYSEQHQQVARLWIGFLLGIVVGSAGAFATWQRSRRTPEAIALVGIARTFQNIRLFHNMTVLENVLVGMDRRFSKNVLRMLFRTPGQRREENQCLGRAMELLEFVGLSERRHSLAKDLPYGDQRRLEIARALAASPKLLLLDEPAAGMNPAESADLVALIRKIRAQSITVLLIEHHMKLVMDISDRIVVLNYGRKIAEGTPSQVRANPQVIEAYLGKEEVS